MMRKRLPEGLEARLVGDVAAGRLRVAVETVGLDELRAAIARLERGEVAGRVVLEW
jgi:D-arabinose 1-dehydrogenase-like Zn-dependent alcohol dehydrogenase